MALIALHRLQREIKEVMRSGEISDLGMQLEPIDNNLKHLRGTIKGPPDTPYEGGTFNLDFQVPDSYPFNPPKVKFTTFIWHPNISSVTGAICLDILKDKWAAAMTLRTVLLSIQALLSSPEPDDPQDAVVAKQYLSNIATYMATARHWTRAFAGGSYANPEFDAHINKLKDMGVEEHQARVALSSSNWNISTATEAIFK